MRYVLAFIFPPAAALMYGGFWQFILNILLTLFFWFPGLIHAFVIIINDAENKANNQLTELKKLGFSVDYLIDGTLKVAFDDKARKVAFIGTDTWFQYSYDDIKTWEWNWIDKSMAHRVRRDNNSISFKIKDKNRPLIKVGISNTKTAEHWHSKLDAILND